MLLQPAHYRCCDPLQVVARTEGAARAECSDDHFSVDGTLIESMASMKSFRPKQEQSDDGNNDEHDAVDDDRPSDSNSFKPRNPDVDFHGTRRTNDSHCSRTDPEARLYRKGKGKPSQLAHMGHLLTENRNGMIMEVDVTEANGTAERDAAVDMPDRHEAQHGRRPKTLGADAGYDAGEFFIDLESREVEPHVAMHNQEPADPSTIRKADRKRKAEARMRMRERVTSKGYAISQKVRKKIEECFGWQKKKKKKKKIAGAGRSRWKTRWQIKQNFELTAAAYNLLRFRKLTTA